MIGMEEGYYREDGDKLQREMAGSAHRRVLSRGRDQTALGDKLQTEMGGSAHRPVIHHGELSGRHGSDGRSDGRHGSDGRYGSDGRHGMDGMIVMGGMVVTGVTVPGQDKMDISHLYYLV